jgi:ankyrin repeat protein
MTTLIEAIKSRDLDNVNKLLNSGISPNATGYFFHTTDSIPLYVASSVGDLDIIRSLIEHGADVNKLSTTNFTALYAAAENNNYQALELLLTSGATKETINACGYFDSQANPLSQAVLNENISMVKLLGMYGGELNLSDSHLLKLCANHKDTHMAEFLLDNGADINKGYATGNTALVAATAEGNLQMVDFLLNEGAWVSSKFGDELSAAVYSSWPVAMVNLYIEHGVGKIALENTLHQVIKNASTYEVKIIFNAIMNNHDLDFEYSPLSTCANTHASVDVAKLFLDVGFNVNYVGEKNSSTPLHDAVNNNELKLTKLFLENGAVDSIDNGGRSAFYKACDKGSYLIAKELLDHGSNVDFIVSKPGFEGTALHIVSERYEDYGAKWLKLLLEYGADVNLVDNNGNTAFHRLFQCHTQDQQSQDKKYLSPDDMLTASKILLEHGANITILNDNLKNPLDLSDKYFGSDDESYDKFLDLVDLYSSVGYAHETVLNLSDILASDASSFYTPHVEVAPQVVIKNYDSEYDLYNEHFVHYDLI